MMGRKSDVDLTLSHYHSLNATIEPLSKTSHDYAVIAKYLSQGQQLQFAGGFEMKG